MVDFTSISRTEWIRLGEQLAERIEESCASFTGREWERTTPYLGWSVRDVVAHMTSAMPVNFREVLDRALRGQPQPPAEFDTFTRNAREVNRRRGIPIRNLLQEFHKEYAALLSTYRNMSDRDWMKPAWFFVGPVTVRSLFLVQLGDNILHERDLMVVNGRWQGFDSQFIEPLVDWFMRELRPANFRPEQSQGFHATVLYRLRGVAPGNWTLTVGDKQCRVVQGEENHPDAIVDADAEDLFLAAQARAALVVGTTARRLAWIGGPRQEDFVAAVTGMSAMMSALLFRRVRISGKVSVARRLNHCFWHFWQRTKQTRENIAKGSTRGAAV